MKQISVKNRGSIMLLALALAGCSSSGGAPVNPCQDVVKKTQANDMSKAKSKASAIIERQKASLKKKHGILITFSAAKTECKSGRKEKNEVGVEKEIKPSCTVTIPYCLRAMTPEEEAAKKARKDREKAEKAALSSSH